MEGGLVETGAAAAEKAITEHRPTVEGRAGERGVVEMASPQVDVDQRGPGQVDADVFSLRLSTSTGC